MSNDQDKVTFTNQREYLDWVIDTTKRMLGLIYQEMKLSEKNQMMSELDKAHFTITIDTVMKLQAMAQMARDQEIGLITPLQGLTDHNGRPL